MAPSRIDIGTLLPALERGATLLVPNHRVREAIVAAYADTITARVFATPKVYAIDIWWRELWDLSAHGGAIPVASQQLLNATEERFIWTTRIEKSLAELPLLNPEETANVASQSYRDLKQWLPQNALGQLRQFAATPDVVAFEQWVRSYRDYCQSHKLISLVDSIEELLGQPVSVWHNLIGMPTEICLVNFFEPPPVYVQLFKRLGEITKVSEFLLRNSVSNTQNIRFEFADQGSELVSCGHWARELAQQQPNAHIGIICAEDVLGQATTAQLLDKALRGNQVAATPSSEAVYNSSGARQTLLDTGLIQDAFLLLNLTHSHQATSDLSRLLHSPFVTGADAESEARMQMELLMRRRFSATTALADFSWYVQQPERDTYSPLLAEALLAARSRQRQFPDTTNAREWARHFNAWLDLFGWPGISLQAGDRALIQQWQDTLRVFAEAALVLGKMSFATALHRLRSCCSQHALSRGFQAELGVSVYTPAEAIGLRFDHIWLLGFSAQSWPASARPSPFIPHALQVQAQIPGSHSDIQLQRAGRQMAILRESVSGQLIASHHRGDGELEFNPSSFISAWPLRASAHSNDTNTALLRSNNQPSRAMATITDPAAFALAPDESIQGGQSIISNQSSCPFRAFSKHRLHAEPLEPFATGLSMRDRGSAVHVALETLFSHIDSSTALNALDTSSRSTEIDRAATQGIEYLGKHHKHLMTPRFRNLEHRRLAKLLENFLALESSREPFHVVAREQAVQWQHDQLQLRLKIDRVDALDDNTLVLIDYKTGKRISSSQSWIDDRPEDMQLPIYYTATASAQERPISALAIAHVNVEKIAYSGLAASANFHATLKPVSDDRRIDMTWPEITAQWQRNVQQRAQEFVEGQARVAPVNGRLTCQYCGLEALCRIQELDSSITDDDTEDQA